MSPMVQAKELSSRSLHDFFRAYKKVLTKPNQKKSFQMIKGIIEGETVQMCEIGRNVAKEIQPKTFCKKIGACLKEITILQNVQLIKARRYKFKALIMDESDIQRTKAEKIEEVIDIRDGSTGDVNGQGYGLITIVGVTDKEDYIPLVLQRYTDIQIGKKKAMESILNILGPHHGALWIIDRGSDDMKMFTGLLEEEQEFLIRLDRKGGQRNLIIADEDCHKEESYSISELTNGMGEVGYRRVKLKGRKEVLTLIHYEHGKQEPLALLTTKSPRTLKQAKNIAKMYLKRWKIEDYFRFIKQRFNVEHLMLQYPERIDGLLALVLVASSFIMEQMFKIKTSHLYLFYKQWKRKENCHLSWSSLARFFCSLFKRWNLIFRIHKIPPNPFQLNLFPL